MVHTPKQLTNYIIKPSWLHYNVIIIRIDD